MSKRALKKYLQELDKEALEEQIFDLYDRLKEVREFYDFVFNPKEDRLMEQAKFKIGKEYFPPGKRRAKKRRSVAQKEIKNFVKLGVSPEKIADVMLYHLEIALTYTAETEIKQEAFYKSMLKGFKEAVVFTDRQGLEAQFSQRIEKIARDVFDQDWVNKYAFDLVLENRY